MIRFLIWILLGLIILLQNKCSGLQVVHNNPNQFNSTTTPQINDFKQSYIINSNKVNNYNNNEEDDDIESSIETTTNIIRTRPPILKVYSENITVKLGQAAFLNCGSLNQITQDEYFQIKSVIWTQELSSPRLLANNGDLFVKNERFSLVKSSLTLTENFQSKYLQTIFNKPKYYDIKICPTQLIDAGWYSCYIVKKSMFNQNVKYYTYLNVIDSNDYNNYDNDEEDDKDFSEICSSSSNSNQDTTIVDLKSVISEMVATRTSVLSEMITSTIKHESTTDFLRLLRKNLTEDESNTNFTIKRQLYNPNYEIIDPESTNKKEIINEIKKIYSITTKQTTTKTKHIKEDLNVNPKRLNISEYNSFQFDCTYTGPHYLSVKLVWFKDNVLLDKKDNRIFTLDLKQNYTRISILKFVYTLPTDTGYYKCVTSRKNLTDSFYLNVHNTKLSFKSKLDSFLKFPFGSLNRASKRDNFVSYSVNLFTTLFCFFLVEFF